MTHFKELFKKVRGTIPLKPSQKHRNKYREAKNGYKKHRQKDDA